MVFTLFDPLVDQSQCLFQEFGRLFAIRAFETHGVNFDFAGGRNDDFNGSIHFLNAFVVKCAALNAAAEFGVDVCC